MDKVAVYLFLVNATLVFTATLTDLTELAQTPLPLVLLVEWELLALLEMFVSQRPSTTDHFVNKLELKVKDFHVLLVLAVQD